MIHQLEKAPLPHLHSIATENLDQTFFYSCRTDVLSFWHLVIRFPNVIMASDSEQPRTEKPAETTASAEPSNSNTESPANGAGPGNRHNNNERKNRGDKGRNQAR